MQKRRIFRLEKHVALQEQELAKLKEKKWMDSKNKPLGEASLDADLVSLDKKIKSGQLRYALQQSSKIKKKFPRSKALLKRRVHILKKWVYGGKLSSKYSLSSKQQ